MFAEWLGVGGIGRNASGLRSTQVRILLPSKHPEFRFDVELKIEWRARTGDVEPIVIQKTRSIAEDVLSRHEIVDCQRAQQDLAAELVTRLPLRLGVAAVVRVGSRIDVDPECREEAMQLQGLTRQYRFESLMRNCAKARVDFLKNEVLRNPADAELYILATADGYFGKIPRGEALSQLVADVAWWEPANRWLVVARLVHDYVANLSDGQARELIRAFAAVAEATGDRDFADKIRAEVL
ncbi:hypothetical protein [Micromonospora trifolii]|uniref:hypothetical protein n=1 Tax=Micromonospora trifolii TaxID=2911208 RepID=UPI003CE716D5